MRKILLAIPLTLPLLSCVLTLDHTAANADTYLDPAPYPGSAEEALTDAQRELARLGFRLIIRDDGVRRLTTLPDRVLLPPNWEDRPLEVRVQLLRHELTHARQWRALGELVFGVDYARESSRWVLEMHGYRQTIGDKCAQGESHEAIVAYITARALAFPKSYKFLPHHRAMVGDATREVLTLELERCGSLTETPSPVN